MTYCEDYIALLSAFADDACTPEEARQVREHLAVCPGCQAWLEELQMIRKAFPTVEDTEVPEGFADGICAAVRAQAISRRRVHGPRWVRVLAPMAACLLLVVALRSISPNRNIVPSGTAGQFAADASADSSGHQTTEALSRSAAPEAEIAEEPAVSPASQALPDESASSGAQSAGGSREQASKIPSDSENSPAVAFHSVEGATAENTACTRSLTLTEAEAAALPESLRQLLQPEDAAAVQNAGQGYMLAPEAFDQIAALYPDAEIREDSESNSGLCLVYVVPDPES